MADKLKQLWSYIQDLLDVRGDVIMCIMSVVFISRVAASLLSKFPALTASEVALYSTAIAAFSYSNVNQRPK